MNKILFSIVLLVCSIWTSGVKAQDNADYVLLLNSSNFGTAWTDLLRDAVTGELQSDALRIKTEELLVPLMQTPQDAQAKREYLLAKYPTPPRAVIYIGDPGWLVCRPIFDKEWKDIPTVICYSRDSMPGQGFWS